MNSIKKNITNLFLLFFSIIFTFIFLELFLIWDDYFKNYEKPYITEINNVKYEIYFDKKKLNNKKKIYIIGDSFIQGDFCAFDQKTLPDEMQKINKDFNIINLGIGGKSLPNYLDIFQEIIPKKGDKVLIFLYDNDIFVSKEMCKLSIIHQKKFGTYSPSFCEKINNNNFNDRSTNTLLKYINSKIRTLKTVSVVKDAFVNIAYFKKFFFRNEYKSLWSSYNSEENIYITNLIIFLKNYIESRQAEFYLTYFPNTTDISIDNPERKMWINYFEFLETNHKISSINSYEYLIANAPKKSMTRSLSDDHPSCDVYKILAPFYLNFIKN
jgi:hypothetical protein